MYDTTKYMVIWVWLSIGDLCIILDSGKQASYNYKISANIQYLFEQVIFKVGWLWIIFTFAVRGVSEKFQEWGHNLLLKIYTNYKFSPSK